MHKKLLISFVSGVKCSTFRLVYHLHILQVRYFALTYSVSSCCLTLEVTE